MALKGQSWVRLSGMVSRMGSSLGWRQRGAGSGKDSERWVPPVRARAAARQLARARARQLALLVSAGLAVVAVRSGLIMLLPDERLESKAQGQFHSTVVLEARRGDIFSQDGRLLATTVSMPTLHADPSRIPPEEIPQLAAMLADLLGKDEAWLRGRLSRPKARDVLLERDLDPSLVRPLRALGRGGKLFTRDENRRYYPDGRLAAALLGVVGHNGAGREGLERGLDEQLRGDTFQFVQSRDRRGRGLRSAAAALQAAHVGHDVTLTLDHVIQFAAEQALDDVMERSEPESANLVALDVRSGAIVALVNRPNTNTNNRGQLQLTGLRNHAVADAVEPGSVFKPFIVALAMEAGLVTPESMVDCEGGRWRIRRTTIRDDHPHGVITLGEVIKYSSNIGAAKLALRLGARKSLAGLRDFGFSRPTATGMPGEVKGMMRSAGRIKPIELATTAYGQGVTSTTLQLASAVATLANDGVRMEPHIVSQVLDRRGDIVSENLPKADRRVVSAQVARDVTRMMVTVTEPGGTATRARVEGYPVAGKTGTAWKVVDGRYSPTARIGAFIGFLPADDPVLAIAVIVDTPHKGSRYGGIVAAPAFAQVGAAAMRHLGIPRRPEVQDPSEDGVEEARVEDSAAAVAQASLPEESDPWSLRPLDDAALALTWAEDGKLRLPDLSGLGLRDVLVLFQDSGVQLALNGHGRAVGQTPVSGSLIALGDRVEVSFQ